MIVYNPGRLGISFICNLRGSAIPRVMFWTLPCCLASVVLHISIYKDRVVSEEDADSNRASSVFFSMFASILGFLIALRLQQAYSRWWEGATVLHQLCTEWSHSFGTLMAFCNSSSAKYEDVRRFQHHAARLYSLLFGCAITQLSTEPCEVLDLEGFDSNCLEFLKMCGDPCEVVMLWIQKLIAENDASQVVNVPAPILSRVFDKLGDGMVNLSHAKKIKEFHIPFPLAQIHMLMLTFNTMVTPLYTAALADSPSNAAILCFVVVFSYWSVLYIALDLEEPFSDNLNNLPMLGEEAVFNNSLCTLLHGWTQKVPGFTVANVDNVEIKKQFIPFRTGGKVTEQEKLISQLYRAQKSQELQRLHSKTRLATLQQLEANKLQEWGGTNHDSLKRSPSSSSFNHVPADAAFNEFGMSQIINRSQEPNGMSRIINRSQEPNAFSVQSTYQSPKEPEDSRSFGRSSSAKSVDLDSVALFVNLKSNEDLRSNRGSRSSAGKDIHSASYPKVLGV